MWATSPAPAWWWIGAAVAPTVQLARYRTTVSNQFGSCHATMSPRPIPRFASAPASDETMADSSSASTRRSPSTIRGPLAVATSRVGTSHGPPGRSYRSASVGTKVGRTVTANPRRTRRAPERSASSTARPRPSRPTHGPRSVGLNLTDSSHDAGVSCGPRTRVPGGPPGHRVEGDPPLMRLGLVTPVVTLVPHAHAPWERTRAVEDVVRIAEAADRLGFDHLTCAEHVALPGRRRRDPGQPLLGPARDARIPCLGDRHGPPRHQRRWSSATTTRSRSRSATARSTRSRADGWCSESGSGRSRRSSTSSAPPSPTGASRPTTPCGPCGPRSRAPGPATTARTTASTMWCVDPSALQSHVPDLGRWPHRPLAAPGGRARRRLVSVRPHRRRDRDRCSPAPPTPTPGDDGRARSSSSSRSPRAFDPLGDPDRAATMAAGLAEVGATILSVRLVSRSADHYVDQMAAMADLVDPM